MNHKPETLIAATVSLLAEAVVVILFLAMAALWLGVLSGRL